MKRLAFFIIISLLLLSSCQKKVNSDHPVIINMPTETNYTLTTPIPLPSPTQAKLTPLPTLSPEVSSVDDKTPPMYPIPIGICYDKRSLHNESLSMDLYGGYAENSYYPWEAYSFGNPPIDPASYIFELDEEEAKKIDFSNNFIETGEKVILYGMDGNHYEGTTKGLPTFSWDEGVFFLKQTIAFENNLNLPSGHYIGVFGTWEALPRTPLVIDENGSIKIDLDNDGQEEVIYALRKKNDKGNDTIQFVANYKGKQFKLDDFNINPYYFGKYQNGAEEQPFTYAFAFPIDVNGDDILEVVLFARTDSGAHYANLYAIHNEKIKRVLEWGEAP